MSHVLLRRWRHAALAVLSLLCIAPASALAVDDPSEVQFKLEGCRLQAGETLPNAGGQFICPDADYTTGNLAKLWNELDLVPHRLTASSSTGDQTYAIAIAADRENAGRPGYDVISAPVVTSGPCTVSAGAEQTLTPGVGGTDVSIYRILTITQPANSSCQLDWYERLALGSHLYAGSSLHSDLLNQSLTTAGIGAHDIPLPVNQIIPQSIAKTMSATQGASEIWNVTKDATPIDLLFANTCDSVASARQANVTITLTWTKSAPVAGQITIVTNITLSNPAHREITASVTDQIYNGSTQVVSSPATSGTNPWSSGAVSVPALSTRTLTHTITVPVGTAAGFNDVATATYTDAVTGVPIPGTTTASASAPVVTNNAPNGTATIEDVEQITGAGLTFAVTSVTPTPALPGSGFTGGYTLGTFTAGPVTWSSGTVNASGQVVFAKTVAVDQPRWGTGTLSDTATLADKSGTTHTASAATTITARACISGHKFSDLNGNGALDPGEPGLAGVTVYVDLNANGAFDPGEPSAVTDANGDYSIANVPDGSYAVREVVPDGYTCTFPVPCSYNVMIAPGQAIGGLEFGNHPPAPSITPSSTPVTSPAVTPSPVVKNTVTGRVNAKLHGPSGCVARPFHVYVTGSRIAKVTFILDGRRLRTLTRPNRGANWRVSLDPRKVRVGVHKLTVKVTFVSGSSPATKTMSLRVDRCAATALRPAFTG